MTVLIEFLKTGQTSIHKLERADFDSRKEEVSLHVQTARQKLKKITGDKMREQEGRITVLSSSGKKLFLFYLDENRKVAMKSFVE